MLGGLSSGILCLIPRKDHECCLFALWEMAELFRALVNKLWNDVSAEIKGESGNREGNAAAVIDLAAVRTSKHDGSSTTQ